MTYSENQTSRPSWHNKTATNILKELDSHETGLSEQEAKNRLQRYGPNRLAEPPGRHPIMRFIRHFHNILIYVLLLSAGITALLGHLVDTLVILAVVLINAVIGYIQEGRAEKAMTAIRNMLALRSSVLRDGSRHTVEVETLVPGDVVLLEAGDKVPADLRLLASHGLQVQESILTGESLPVEKQTEPVAAGEPIGDRHCMAYSGTLVTSGTGKGLVVTTGADTEIGRISGLLSRVETLTTPLIRQMDEFARWLSLLILTFAVILLLYGYFVAGYSFNELFMAVVGLSVAAIPEGLPAVLTITLAVGVQAMARRHTIVRRLPAIETLGSVSVICTDKTGTLTRNEMMVSTLVSAAGTFSVEGTGYEPSGALLTRNAGVSPQHRTMLDELGRTAALCNDARLHHQDGIWTVEGDPMEGALLTLAGKIQADREPLQDGWTRTDQIPFDARHRFMATLNHDHEGHACIHVKGAPERVLALCRDQRSADGATAPLDRDYWTRQAEDIAAEGQRVLALALRTVPSQEQVLETADLDQQLTLIGLVGLMDPPRSEAIEAIHECHEAGIRVKMITGDHSGTASAIGRKIGLRNPDKVLTGADIDDLDDTALAAAVLETDIFARTSPEHKLRLVVALQSHHLTVAMTGDGVNDAPALKRADAGIAMGLKGTEAAKEAAELVLVDDNFASIAAAVREGRTVYDNIKKVIGWTLPTSMGEAATIIVALLLGMTLPITPVQILWVNLITAITLGLALAFEPTEPGTMKRPPRQAREPLLNGALIWQIALVSLVFLAGVFGVFSYATQQNYPIELAQTMAMNTLVVMEIFNLFFVRNLYGTSLNWRSLRGTRVIWATIIIVTLAQFLVTYLPLLQSVFRTQAVPVVDGLLIVGVGMASFGVVEIIKQIRLRVVGGASS